MTADVRILHVDDDVGRLERTAARLESMDDRLTVRSTSDPAVALDVLEDGAIDWVVSAYRMDGTDGLELLTSVREHQPTCPFILYTGEGSEAVASDAISAGVTDYLRLDAETTADQLAETIMDAIEQRPAAQRARKYERVAALVRNVQSELVHATSRAAIDTAVCEMLVDAEPYVFAWIGEYRDADERVVPRASAGHQSGYLSGLEITVDDTATGRGPTGLAVQTRSLQVVQDLESDPAYESWRDDALESGYRASAAVPLVHENTLYGVLNVYADRTGVFEPDEQAMLAELGKTIAHAYHRVQLQTQYEAQYQELFEEAPVMVALTRTDPEDGEPVIDDCNRRFARKLGYAREELRGQPLADVYAEPSATKLATGGHERARAGESVTESRTLITRDGERLSTQLQSTPRRDPTGETIGTHALFVDMTDQERAQGVLGQAAAMEASMDGMAILDDDRNCIYANEAHAEIYGYADREAFIGTDWRTLLSDDEIERFEDDVVPTLAEEGAWRGEATGVRADGSTFPKELSLAHLEDGRVVSVVRDITERRERQQRLEHSKERLRVLFDRSPDAIFVHDTDGTIVDVNDRATTDLGYSRAELLSFSVGDIEVEDDLEELRELWTTMDVGKTATVQGRHRRKDGSTYPVEVWISKITLDETERILALSRDITARKERERERRRQTDLFERAQEIAAIGAWETDLQAERGWWTEQVCRIFGLPTEYEPGPGEGIEQFHPDDQPVVREAFERAIDTGEPYDLELRLGDESESRWVHVRGDPQCEDGETVRIRGTIQDITDRKQYEEALEQARDELQQIIDLVPDMLFVKNRDGEYILANETTATYYDRPRSAVEGKTDVELLPDTEQARQFHQDDIAVIDSGEPMHGSEEALTTADGETRILQTTKLPYEIAGTGDAAVLGYARDVTELKEYERQLETQRDNLEVLNQVVRHDIRNDLQLVLAYAEMLEEVVDEAGREYVDQVLASARDAVAITETARDVSEVMLQADTEPTQVRLRYTLEHELDEIRSTYENAVVTTEGTIPRLEVVADDMLESVFRNLLTNAIEHNDAEIPVITVSASVEGDDVEVQIADNGPGIPDERKATIFEEGEKGLESDGTGLGLYLVRTLVDRYGGDVWVADRTERWATDERTQTGDEAVTGSVFTVRLPIAS
ncbi:PAS domain S-box protein [Natronorubrum thiooxidans]|uniref:histidine kinase n=1 Tax=Natronorubrum thiooxidans TaxID=308853 RepID=A0A1N7E604_9EURY|nr:PAS domain S-box protein [Natronorubrum thiooxidans]SIR83573.1 PAS domain S-box-containing protein [Natronorubrum thiooxidans]